MKKLKEVFNIMGMRMDPDAKQDTNSYAYFNCNIRIVRNDDYKYALVNEHSNKRIQEYSFSSDIQLGSSNGISTVKKDVIFDKKIIGYYTIENYLFIFLAKNSSDETDEIRAYNIKDDTSSTRTIVLSCTSTVKKDFGWTEDTILEISFNRENRYISKLYWSSETIPFKDGYMLFYDGILNVDVDKLARENKVSQNSNSTNDLNPDLTDYIKDLPYTTVSKILGGSLPAGSVQYFICYVEDYSNLSDVLWVSPILGVSSVNNNPADNRQNTLIDRSYKITIPKNSMYYKCFVVHSSSLTADKQVYDISDSIVVDTTNKTTVFVDTIKNRKATDSDFLINLIDNAITFKTSTIKNNVKFVGNIAYQDELNGQPSDKLVEYAKALKIEPVLLASTIASDQKYGNLPTESYKNPNDTEVTYVSNIANKYMVHKSNTHFKGGEIYRTGIQLQDKYGHWSNVIYLKDIEVDKYIQTGVSYFLQFPYIQINQEATDIAFVKFRNKAIAEGYINVRPVVCYPDVNQRKVLMQGVVNPTIFAYTDRADATVYGMTSYLWRFMNTIDGMYTWNYKFNGSKNDSTTTIDLQRTPSSPNFSAGPSAYKYGNLIPNYAIKSQTVEDDGTIKKIDYFINDGFLEPLSGNPPSYNNFQSGKLKGTVFTPDGSNVFSCKHTTPQLVENRHFFPIPNRNEYNAEYVIRNPGNTIRWYGIKLSTTHQKGPDLAIDTSLISFFSPELEFDATLFNLDYTSVKCRIIGYIPITGYYDYIDTELDMAHKDLKTSNITKHIVQGPLAATYYTTLNPYTSYLFKKDGTNYSSAYRMYQGGIHFFDTPTFLSGTKSSYSKIKTKLRTLYHYSNRTEYFSTVNDFVELSNLSSKSATPTTIYKALNNDTLIDNSLYKKDVDTTLVTSEQNVQIPYLNTNDGEIIASVTAHAVMPSGSLAPKWGKGLLNEFTTLSDDTCKSNNGIGFKFKSLQHLVIKINPTKPEYSIGLPRFKYGDATNLQTRYIDDYASSINSMLNIKPYIFDSLIKEVVQPIITTDEIPEYLSLRDTEGDGIAFDDITNSYPYNGYLWLVELYRDNITEDNCFNGNSENSLENCQWCVCGLPKNIETSNNLLYGWGDTYYCRYDCMKTTMYTEEDTNQIIDTLSFMCETRINIEGCYDLYRKPDIAKYARFSNHNLLNDVYSKLSDNIVLPYINTNKLYVDSFPYNIMWSTEKFIGETLDSWLKFHSLNTISLQGEYGIITKLITFKDNIICFQPDAVSVLNYDSRLAMTAEDSTMNVVMQNSKKVEGFEYLTTSYGCSNTNSVCMTDNYLYFYDIKRNCLVRFDGKTFVNLTELKGMVSYFNYFLKNSVLADFNNYIKDNVVLATDSDIVIPDPPDNPGPIYQNANKVIKKASSNSMSTDGRIIVDTAAHVLNLYYDYNTKDVYLYNSAICFAFNEQLDEFTSQYSYPGIKFMFNIYDNLSSILDTDNSLWQTDSVTYGNIYGTCMPYYTTIKSSPKTRENPLGMQDYIFESVEYVNELYDGTTYISDKTFDTLRTQTPYSDSTEFLRYSRFGGYYIKGNERNNWQTTNLQKMYGIWRAQLPRPAMRIHNEDYPYNHIRDGRSYNTRITTNYNRYPWAAISLMHYQPDYTKGDKSYNYKSLLHNLDIVYYVDM